MAKKGYGFRPGEHRKDPAPRVLPTSQPPSRIQAPQRLEPGQAPVLLGRVAAGTNADGDWINAVLGEIFGPVLGDILGNILQAARIVGIPAGTVAKQGHGVYFETCEQDLEAALGWDRWEVGGVVPANGVGSLEAGGQAGGQVWQADGFVWTSSPDNIAFDPGKLYRLRARVRITAAATDPAKDLIYLGLLGIAADGVTLVNRLGVAHHGTQHYLNAAIDMGAQVLNEWIELTGWFKGWGTPNGSVPLNNVLHGSPLTPITLHADVRYIRPLIVLNYNGGDGVMQLDELAIDVFDELAAQRIYAATATDSLLEAGVGQTDGVATRSLVIGRQRFSGVRHGDVITFAPAFQAPPVGRHVGGGLTYQPAALWGNGAPGALAPLAKAQYQEVRFNALTASSCTVWAVLRQNNTVLTLRDNNFGGGSLNAPAEEAQATLVDAPSYNGQYSVRVQVAASADMPLNKSPDWCSIELVYAVDVHDGVGWTQVHTGAVEAVALGYGASDSTNEPVTIGINDPDLDAGDLVRVRVVSVTEAGNPGRIVSASVDPNDVQYHTSGAADRIASMTPDAQDGLIVEFEATS